MGLFRKVLDWVRGLWKQAPPVIEFPERERQIYRYWDGEKDVKADPMRLYKDVMRIGPSLAIDIKVAQSASKDNVNAHDRWVKQVRQVFGLKPFEEGGLTELEAIRVMDEFLDYVEEVKKNSSPAPTSANPTEPPSSSGEDSTSSPTSDSGSTVAESSTVEPTQPTSDPESPGDP